MLAFVLASLVISVAAAPSAPVEVAPGPVVLPSAAAPSPHVEVAPGPVVLPSGSTQSLGWWHHHTHSKLRSAWPHHHTHASGHGRHHHTSIPHVSTVVTVSPTVATHSTAASASSVPPPSSADSASSLSPSSSVHSSSVHSSSAHSSSTHTATSAPTSNAAASSSSQRASSSSAKPTTSATASPSSTSLSPSAAAYLEPHNTLRAKHSAKPLTWSEDLANAAKSWASKCQWAHSGGVVGNYGENIAAGTGNFDAKSAVAAWASEESQYDPQHPTYSHFTQMVWKATTQVGCSVVSCPGLLNSQVAQLHVCEYSVPGNVAGQFPANVL